MGSTPRLENKDKVLALKTCSSTSNLYRGSEKPTSAVWDPCGKMHQELGCHGLGSAEEVVMEKRGALGMGRF